MRILALALLLATSPLHAAPRGVDPASLFEGTSQGRGELRLGFGHPRAYRVDNVGHREDGGSFRLDQVVHFDGEPAHPRHWVIAPTRPGRYAFRLSDAVGPGIAWTDGTRLQLRFAPRHGLRMHQVLRRNADGSIDNVGTIRLLGIPIGHLHETITPVH